MIRLIYVAAEGWINSVSILYKNQKFKQKSKPRNNELRMWKYRLWYERLLKLNSCRFSCYVQCSYFTDSEDANVSFHPLFSGKFKGPPIDLSIFSVSCLFPVENAYSSLCAFAINDDGADTSSSPP